MLKKLLVSCFALALVLPLTAQHNRRVLIEEFTNASCGPCASQNPAFNAAVAANSQYLTPIKYQTNWPGFDPMNQQTQPEVGVRVTYYGVGGVPNGRQNGNQEVAQSTPVTLVGYNTAAILAAYNNLTPVTMTISHSLTSDFDSILVHVEVTSDQALTGNLRLRAAVTEEEIIFEKAPGSNGEKEFFQVMRKMLPNAGGTATGDFAAGETKVYDFAWKLDYIYDLNQLSAIAWLQNDGNKEVWQSARSLPIGGVPALGIKVPTTTAFNCVSGAKASFPITNTASAPLTNAEFRYRVGTGAWNNLTWTGSLASGATTDVVLDSVSLTQTSTTKIEVEVISSNNGIQTNMVGAVSTYSIRSLLNAPTPTPLLHDFQSGSVPPAGWTVVNFGTHGWRLITTAGAGSSRSARCNFWDIVPGEKVSLVTPELDFTNTAATYKLSFDHAYTYVDATYFDSLNIQVSTDCGQSWTSVFHNGYEGLATAPPLGSAAFLPTADQWSGNELDLSAFAGHEVLIRFLGESGYGNNLYIDNINVQSTVGTKELNLSDFTVQPNPTRDLSNVQFSLIKPENIDLFVFDAVGALVQSQSLGSLSVGSHTVKLDATRLNAGSYRVVLQGSEGVAQLQFVVIK